ncbi:MAG TPA: MerC domain-containing protein [Gammaproteobacteria bacterium]|nr:MerC domain-containing protein [Gammaproteobacteria bacterium]
MTLSRYFDRVAIALSTICIVHCLAMPLVVAVLPIAAISFGGNAHFHSFMLWLVVPSSVVGFGLGFRVHRRASIVLLGGTALVVLATAALWGHAAWSALVEVTVSVAASVVLAAAHWRNFREVRRLHRHEAAQLATNDY